MLILKADQHPTLGTTCGSLGNITSLNLIVQKMVSYVKWHVSMTACGRKPRKWQDCAVSSVTSDLNLCACGLLPVGGK